MNAEAGPSSSKEAEPARTPTRFIACVNQKKSVEPLRTYLEPHGDRCTVLHGDNLKGAQDADVVLLACKPYMAQTILQARGTREALRGKLLISILAGKAVGDLEALLQETPEGKCETRVVVAVPNVAASIGESMTVVAASDPPLADADAALVAWIFDQVGRACTVPPHLVAAATALAGSGIAFMAQNVEGYVDGGVGMGMPWELARTLTAQTMKGAAALVQAGEHPALLREKVTTPGGCTSGGLTVLEEGRVRWQLARAVREATDIVPLLGKGYQGVNGTRFQAPPS